MKYKGEKKEFKNNFYFSRFHLLTFPLLSFSFTRTPTHIHKYIEKNSPQLQHFLVSAVSAFHISYHMVFDTGHIFVSQ